MQFPFETQSIKDLIAEKALVMYKNQAYLNKFDLDKEVVLSSDGSISNKGKWEVIDGVLRLLNSKGHLEYEFRGIETRNGVIYGVGRNVLENGHRVILSIKEPINNNFGVCISSHVDYEKKSLVRALDSLRKDNFDMEKVVVTIGNNRGNDTMPEIDKELGVLTIRRRNDVFGFTALGHVPRGTNVPFWLLLHDTCEVTKGFKDKISEIDIGIKPDVILFRPPSDNLELGLYASSFADKVENIPGDIKPFEYLYTFTQKAKTVVNLNSLFKKEPPRDVYGYGIKRETISFVRFGINKYRSDVAHIREP